LDNELPNIYTSIGEHRYKWVQYFLVTGSQTLNVLLRIVLVYRSQHISIQ